MNEMLREHVTSAAFVLSLGKTHVAALVRLDLEISAEVSLIGPGLRGSRHGRLHQHDHTGRNGLISRGLARHVYEDHKDKYVVQPGDKSMFLPGAVDYDRMPVGECWELTRAGGLVVELLKEAGVYAEYAGPLLPLIEARAERAAAS